MNEADKMPGAVRSLLREGIGPTGAGGEKSDPLARSNAIIRDMILSEQRPTDDLGALLATCARSGRELARKADEHVMHLIWLEDALFNQGIQKSEDEAIADEANLVGARKVS